MYVFKVLLVTLIMVVMKIIK